LAAKPIQVGLEPTSISGARILDEEGDAVEIFFSVHEEPWKFGEAQTSVIASVYNKSHGILS
jgi:hypothetical protein